jgi:molybdopterin-guanine dinucleotide biosynthesis protein A
MISLILAGGENRRFPTLKGFIETEGKTIIERSLGVLGRLGNRVYISTNAPESYFHLRAPLIGDVMPPCGPMGGILSAFLATNAAEVLVTACDMPFIQYEVIKYIIENGGRQATVPLLNGRPEPLLAVYRKEALPVIEGLLRAGERSVTRMLGELDVRYIGEEQIREIDPEGKSFVNVNTLEDFSHAFGRQTEPARKADGPSQGKEV